MPNRNRRNHRGRHYHKNPGIFWTLEKFRETLTGEQADAADDELFVNTRHQQKASSALITQRFNAFIDAESDGRSETALDEILERAALSKKMTENGITVRLSQEQRIVAEENKRISEKALDGVAGLFKLPKASNATTPAKTPFNPVFESSDTCANFTTGQPKSIFAPKPPEQKPAEQPKATGLLGLGWFGL